MTSSTEFMREPLTCLSCRHSEGLSCSLGHRSIQALAYGQDCPYIDYEPGSGPAEYNSYAEYLAARPARDALPARHEEIIDG